jgi:hypothetical protein
VCSPKKFKAHTSYARLAKLVDQNTAQSFSLWHFKSLTKELNWLLFGFIPTAKVTLVTIFCLCKRIDRAAASF